MAREAPRKFVLGLASLLAACGPAGAAAPPGGPAPTVAEPAPDPSGTTSSVSTIGLPELPIGAGLPPIPFVEGLPSIRVVHPAPGTPRPSTRSVLVYGSVGTGAATLTINGFPVEVAPNGAFIGHVPRPANDTLRLEARTADWVGQMDVWYTPPTGGGGPSAPVRTVEYAAPQVARVTAGADTLATGSDVAIGRPTPTGTYRWFLPRGALVLVTGARLDQVRARMGPTDAWFSARDLTAEPVAPASTLLAPPTVTPADEWSDVRLPVVGAPFSFEALDSLLLVELHGVSAGFDRVETGDALVPLVEVVPNGVDGTTVRIYPAPRLWGFKAFYDPDGALVIRVRRPPAVDPAQPLRGIRIVVDPGHPPAGATGPTGLYEGEANLAVGLRLADFLRARGAEVLLTRSTSGDVPLTDRVDAAVAWNAHILVSVHNNAFAEGADPFASNGTSTYYFHPFARGLATAINDEIVATTLARNLGVIRDNLALARPTWMPAVLTESLFMPIPAHEAALRDPWFIDLLAAAHVRGIESFLLGSIGSALSE